MQIVKDIFKLLTFRSSREEILFYHKGHFLVGILGTWIVGMGRYWDDTNAEFLQHLGVGSVIYIFALSLFLWLIILPLRVENWNYFRVLTFISLTSFPAIFYAIPVERYVDLATANTLNVWFLGVVALWRLGLLFYFLKVFTKLKNWIIVVVTLMPMCLIISSLFALNLHQVVFNIMGGLRNPTAHDSSYFVLMALTGLSLVLSIPLLLGYLFSIYIRWNKK